MCLSGLESAKKVQKYYILGCFQISMEYKGAQSDDSFFTTCRTMLFLEFFLDCNCIGKKRSRGWAVLVQAVLRSSAASTRTAQSLDLPF